MENKQRRLGRLYTLGYAARGAKERLEEIMQACGEHATLVDIRLYPFSRYRPEWNRNRLSAFWGKRYVWKHSLGNLNYNNDGPISLANERDGIAWLVTFLQTGRDVVLVCACASFESCHRRTVVEKVQQHLPEVEVC